MFCLRKRNVYVSFTHTKHMFVRGKTDNNPFGAVIYSNNSDFRYFEMKSLVPRTSNIQDSAVSVFKSK